jgi:hypothetical protein
VAPRYPEAAAKLMISVERRRLDEEAGCWNSHLSSLLIVRIRSLLLQWIMQCFRDKRRMRRAKKNAITEAVSASIKLVWIASRISFGGDRNFLSHRRCAQRFVAAGALR